MAEMNLARLPANPQEDCQYIQLKQSLYKLQLSLTEYFCTILTIYQHGQKSSLQDSSFIKIERLQRLALENPKEQELHTASFIRKEMDRILNDPAHHCRDETAPNRELLDAFKCLWTYFQLNEGAGTQRDPAIPSFDRIYHPSSHYHAQEWGETVLCNRVLKQDCEVVTQILQEQTGLLKTSGSDW